MPARYALALAALGAALGACGGSSEPSRPAAPPPPPAPLLSPSSFAQVVAAEVRKRDGALGAELARGAEITVSAGLNWVKVDVASDYAEYEQAPARREAIVARAARRAAARLARGFGDAGFAEVRRDLMPLLKPLRRLRKLPERPAERRFAGDLVVVYAVDRASDFTLVTRDDLARWGKGLRQLDRVAFANLVRRTEPLLCEEELCGWASDDGYDATRMLAPKLRRAIVGEIGPAVYAVPQDDVFVALPLRLADRIRERVAQQFQTGEDGVSPDVFVERDGKLVVLPPS